MPMPSKIRFTSDGNEATMDEDTLDESGDPSAIYIYTKSETKKGQKVEFSLSRINNLIGRTLIIPKNATWVSKKSGASNQVQKKSETAGKTTTELAKMLKEMPEKKKHGSLKGTKK